MFELDILNAKQGDCFVMRYGKQQTSGIVIFDGGASGTWENVLKPRLNSFPKNNGAVEIEKVIITHIDDDHIHGINDMTNELVKKHNNGNPLEYRIVGRWFNSFTDLTQSVSPSGLSSMVNMAINSGTSVLASNYNFSEPRATMIIASIAQGDELARNFQLLGLRDNSDFNDYVVAGKTITLEYLEGGALLNGPVLTIVGPMKKQLLDLKNKWVPSMTSAQMQDYLDKSIPNLSSIAVHVKFENKTLLMTGDIRGDHLLEGLAEAGIKEDTPLHVDLFKLPHHGSDRNVSEEFFKEITANTYVISADGSHHNPDLIVLEWLVNSRSKSDDFHIVFSTKMKKPDLQKALEEKLKRLKIDRKFTWTFRLSNKLGITWPSNNQI